MRQVIAPETFARLPIAFKKLSVFILAFRITLQQANIHIHTYMTPMAITTLYIDIGTHHAFLLSAHLCVYLYSAYLRNSRCRLDVRCESRALVQMFYIFGYQIPQPNGRPSPAHSDKHRHQDHLNTTRTTHARKISNLRNRHGARLSLLGMCYLCSIARNLKWLVERASMWCRFGSVLWILECVYSIYKAYLKRFALA